MKDLTFRVSCNPDVPLGQHDVRAVGTFGVSNPRTFVVGDRPEVAEVEPNNTPDKATPIVVNSVVDGEISSATEIDCFAFEGKKGQRIFCDLQAERIDSRLDATLRILDPSNKEIAESRDVFGTDPFLDVILPADGRYVIKVHDAVYAGSPDHVYRLIVHDGPHLDAILPLAARPGTSGAFTLIGRGLGPGAAGDAGAKVDGRPVERLAVTLARPGIQADRDHPVPALDLAGRRGARSSPRIRARPARFRRGGPRRVQSRAASPRPSGRSSSRRSRITRNLSRRWSSPRATFRAPSASRATWTCTVFRARRATSGSSRRSPSGRDRRPTRHS